jgi:hypothetical protein
MKSRLGERKVMWKVIIDDNKEITLIFYYYCIGDALVRQAARQFRYVPLNMPIK